MTAVGIVGLDTSHADAFASVLSESPDAAVKAVWDGGEIRDARYTRNFSDRYDARICESIEEMVHRVDGVMILTVNWDTHVDLAVPFLEAGIPPLVDKPIAGTVTDVGEIGDAAGVTPVFGGSAVPFHPRLAVLAEKRPISVPYSIGFNDSFYYGSHLVDTVRRLADANWERVTPTTGSDPTATVEFVNGTSASVRLDGSETRDSFTFECEGGETVVIGDSAAERQQMYGAYVRAYLETIDGTRRETERTLDSARLLLAVHAALEGERPIRPGSQSLLDLHVRGDTFAESYEPYY